MLVPAPPPRLEDLPAGTSLVAGLGRSFIEPDIDFETYSEAGYVWVPAPPPHYERKVDKKTGVAYPKLVETLGSWTCLPNASQGKKGLPIVGAAVYAEHPSTEVLSCYYDLKDGRGRRHWRPGLPPPADLFAHVLAGRTLEAWNVSFERWIWEKVCVRKYGWPMMPSPAQWRCAMAKARAFSLAGSLEITGRVLQLEHQKDPDGGRLLDKFSMPRNPTKADPRTRIRPDEEPVDGPKLYAYNERDIVTEAEASAVCPALEGLELRFWQADQEINHRGVKIDTEGLDNCIAIVGEAFRKYNGELKTLTGIDSASKLQQLVGWLAGRGVHVDSLDEEGVALALKRKDLPSDAERVLRIRQLAGSATVKKIYSIKNRLTSQGRIHDLFNYHAARTGRFTGEGPQPTNMANAAGLEVVLCKCGRHHGRHRFVCPWCGAPQPPSPKLVEWCPEAMEDAFDSFKHRSLEVVEQVWGDALEIIGVSIRGMFVASDGCDLMGSDFSSIEAVGLAMISGEQWRIDVFNTHGKIYEVSGAKVMGVSFEDMMKYRKETGNHHPARKPGKVYELACGYGGWINSAKVFGAPGSDEEIKKGIVAWRDASPAVVHLWGGQSVGRWEKKRQHYFGVEGMFIRAMMEPGKWFPVHRLDGSYSGVSFIYQNDRVACLLPSGRLLYYWYPRLQRSTRQYAADWEMAITFWGYNTNPENGPRGWVQLDTYGPRIVENINQGTCRDILRPAVVRLEDRGYPVVLHVYDEVISDVRKGFGSVEHFEATMMERDAWYADWPVKAADGWRGRRYRKG